MPKSNFALKHCENDSIFNQMTQCSSRGKYNQQQSGKCDCIFSQASLQRVCNGTFDHTFIVAGATTAAAEQTCKLTLQLLLCWRTNKHV